MQRTTARRANATRCGMMQPLRCVAQLVVLAAVCTLGPPGCGATAALDSAAPEATAADNNAAETPSAASSSQPEQLAEQPPPISRPPSAAAPVVELPPLPQGAVWSAWRGPRRDGHALDGMLPEAWPEALPTAWDVEIETGWSSPVVADGRVFVTDRQGSEERLLAFDADTGAALWELRNPVDFEPHPVGRRHGNGPKGTPVVATGRVYSLGIAGWLQCADAATGERLWHVHLPAEYGQVQPLPGGRAEVVGTEHVVVPIGNQQGAPAPLFGYTGSPILAGELLVLSVGGQRGGTLMAFHAADGREAWRALDENVSYSSPVVGTLGGVEQVVAMTGPRVVGLELATGKLLWSYPFQIQYDESISTPVLDGDLAVITGDSRPLTALQVAANDAGQRVSVAWTSDDLSSYLSSMVIHDGHVYGMDDRGQFACVRLADGQTLWRGGSHGFYCTPVWCEDRLLCLNERGVLAVVQAQPGQFVQDAKLTLTSQAVWSSPAVLGRRIYVRSDGHLTCYAH